MKFDFSKLFEKEGTISINNYTYKIGYKNNFTLFAENKLEDDDYIVTFYSDGSCNIMCKKFIGNPQMNFVENCKFMDDNIHEQAIMYPVAFKDDITGHSVVIRRDRVMKDDSGNKFNHSVYVECVLVKHPDKTYETEGVSIYVVDSPLNKAK